MSLLNSINIEEKIKKEDYESTFIFQHLPYNLGLTLGNCLRRILFNNVGGFALCGVKISDKDGPVKTKFSDLSGVDKTAFHLIVSLKQIIVCQKTPNNKNKENNKEETNQNNLFNFSFELNNDSSEEKTITAGNFLNINSEEIKIKNPDLVIATLSPNSFIKIDLFFKKDLGYFPEKKQKKFFSSFEPEDFVIILDSNYSPVKNVFPKDDKIITGLLDEEEVLTINIETNGSVSPKEVLNEGIVFLFNLSELLKNKTLLI